MAGSQISTSVTILNSLHGFMALSLTEYNTSAAASIAAGSVVEIAGAFFTFAGDEAINASSWTSIVTGTTAYITLTASGTAGSQIVAAAYTSTAPTWRDDFQGWYASAASNIRVIGTVYKAEAASYYPKFIYNAMQDNKQSFASVNITSSISITQSASALSTVSVLGPFSVTSGLSTLNGQVMVNSYYGTTPIYFSSVNTALLPYTPATNSTILLNGGINLFIGTSINCIYAIRNSPTSMTVYGYSTAVGAKNIVLTGGDVINSIALVW